MKNTGIAVTVLVLLGALLLPCSRAAATTDGVYTQSSVSATWDATYANRNLAPIPAPGGSSYQYEYDHAYGDEATVTYNLPWPFTFYGQTYTQIMADTNGNVWFTATGSAHSFNLANTGRGPVIAVWNNDHSSYYYGGVFVQHKPASERVVIEWLTESYTEEGSNRPNNFGVVLFKDGTIRFYYSSIISNAAKDFGSGISKGDGSRYLNLTTIYGNGFHLFRNYSYEFRDSTPPILTTNAVPSITTAFGQTLSGTMEEGAKITVTSNSSAVVGTVTYPTPTTWECVVTSLASGNNTFVITATDIAGNSSVATVATFAQPLTAWVQGTLKDSTGKLLADMEIQLRNADSSLIATARTSADGTYRIGAFAGVWFVNVLTTSEGLYPINERKVTLTDGQGTTIDFIAIVIQPTPASTISGVVSKGVFVDGCVKVYTINSDGSKGALLQITGINLNGSYAANIGSYVGPVMLEASGSYNDEVTGLIKVVTETVPLRAAIGNAEGQIKMAITPLTEIAVRKVEDSTSKRINISAIDATNSLVSGVFHVLFMDNMPIDPTQTAPAMATEQQKYYTLALAAVSQLMKDKEVDLTIAIAGLNDSISLNGTSASMEAQASSDFMSALLTFVASPGNATGVSDITTTPLAAIDSILPILSISTLTDGSYTNKEILNVSGTLTDNIGVKQLLINGISVPIDPDGSFSHALILKTGENRIEVNGTDLAGNASSDVRTINLDQMAPLLIVTSPADNSKTGALIANVYGTVSETSSVDVFLNGALQSVIRNGDSFTASVTLAPKYNSIGITATDLAGNPSSDKRTIFYDDQKPSIAVTVPGQDILTRQGSLTIQGTASDPYDLSVTVNVVMDGLSFTPQVVNGHFEQVVSFTSEKSYAITVTAINEVGTISSVQRNIIYDITPPALTIDPVISPTAISSQLIGGTREAGVDVAVTCPTATVGTVEYPTDTTWRVMLSNMGWGDSIVTAQGYDAAGNSTSVPTRITVLNIESDVTFTVSPNIIWPPNHKMVPVTLGGKLNIPAADVRSIELTLTDEYGKFRYDKLIFDSTVQVEAWRDGGDKDGRSYTITAVVTRRDGSKTTMNTTVLVPYDMGK